jgi:hypothetical protein
MKNAEWSMRVSDRRSLAAGFRSAFCILHFPFYILHFRPPAYGLTHALTLGWKSHTSL